MMRRRQVALARGRSLDQISQARKGLKAAINRHFGQVDQGADAPLRAGKPRSKRFKGRSCERGLAEPKLRSSEGWRPGLDSNQDKERCTALASTLSATGPRLLSPITPP